MTGLGLGATVSVKWVGLFTIAWVGSLTVLQLWVLLGDFKTVTPVSPSMSPVNAFLICSAPLRQAFRRQSFLSNRHSHDILHGDVRNSLHLSRQPW